jgi:hypothetical protein
MATIKIKPTKVVTFCAEPMPGEKLTPLVIEAVKPIRADVKRLLHGHERHEEEGRKIADALLSHLPGGTVDQVLRFLHEAAASRLVVRHRP